MAGRARDLGVIGATLLRPNYAKSAESPPVMVSRIHAKRSQRNSWRLRPRRGASSADPSL